MSSSKSLSGCLPNDLPSSLELSGTTCHSLHAKRNSTRPLQTPGLSKQLSNLLNSPSSDSDPTPEGVVVGDLERADKVAYSLVRASGI